MASPAGGEQRVFTVGTAIRDGGQHRPDGLARCSVSDKKGGRTDANPVIQRDHIVSRRKDHTGPGGFVLQRELAPKRRLSVGRAGGKTSRQQDSGKNY